MIGVTLSVPTCKFYKNGVFLGNTSATHIAPTTNTARTGKIGKGDGAANYFTGIEGEVAAWGRELISQEIQQIYLSTKWRYQ